MESNHCTASSYYYDIVIMTGSLWLQMTCICLHIQCHNVNISLTNAVVKRQCQQQERQKEQERQQEEQQDQHQRWWRWSAKVASVVQKLWTGTFASHGFALSFSRSPWVVAVPPGGGSAAVSAQLLMLCRLGNCHSHNDSQRLSLTHS